MSSKTKSKRFDSICHIRGFFAGTGTGVGLTSCHSLRAIFAWPRRLATSTGRARGCTMSHSELSLRLVKAMQPATYCTIFLFAKTGYSSLISVFFEQVISRWLEKHYRFENFVLY